MAKRRKIIALADLVVGTQGFVDPTGTTWTPITCGDHAAILPDGITPNPQAGFVRTCPNCQATAFQLVQHYIAAVANDPNAI